MNFFALVFRQIGIEQIDRFGPRNENLVITDTVSGSLQLKEV